MSYGVEITKIIDTEMKGLEESHKVIMV